MKPALQSTYITIHPAHRSGTKSNIASFCHITQTWRARPLTSRIAVVDFIAATTTKTGLKVESVLDTRHYQKGLKVSKAEMKSLNIKGHDFHPEWNCILFDHGNRPKRSTYCS